MNPLPPSIILQAQTLHKSFDSIHAVNGVSLSIKRGEIYGLLGPNGAGKSTMLHLISTLLQPDKGKIIIENLSPTKAPAAIKMLMGVVPQEIALYEDLSARENLAFWGGLYRVQPDLLRQQIDKTLELVGLKERQNDPLRTYSGGMKRRINIAAALLHNPKILLMDEPTVGVDPQSRNHVFEVIEQLQRQGMTILYTTHYMEEAERLCERIGIMDNGRIIAEGTVEELKSQFAIENILSLQLNAKQEYVVSLLNDLGIGCKYITEKKSLQIPTRDIRHTLCQILPILSKQEIAISRIDTQTADLEHVFLQLTGKRLRDQ